MIAMSRRDYFFVVGCPRSGTTLLSVMLDDNGFPYDSDYTTLYGAGWAVTGIEIMSVKANAPSPETFLQTK